MHNINKNKAVLKFHSAVAADGKVNIDQRFASLWGSLKGSYPIREVRWTLNGLASDAGIQESPTVRQILEEAKVLSELAPPSLRASISDMPSGETSELPQDFYPDRLY